MMPRSNILNRFVLGTAVFFATSFAQAQEANYFQQEVNYDIHVQLNDANHTLRAQEQMVYHNNSPLGLDTIYIHLWPNAYKNNETDLAKQLLRLGKTELYYSRDEERGYIDSLDFKVNGSSVKWQYHPQHQDICYLLLPQTLQSGASATITTPFFVKIPDAKFSRLGHDQQAYFITQWYPKPAVFDKQGWHAMPYLNQGEFFSEFGSFDVFITLPENYLLAATGDRIDADDENAFIKKKVQETEAHIKNGTRSETKMDFPASSMTLKTVHFRQFRVHDFAWFADKRFYVLKDQIELPESKRMVDTWVYFTDKNFEYWKSAIKYVNESTLFYSFNLGDYPYNHVTALDGTIMAGGGMEYPNITVINDASSAFELDMVITHEVGHNWFYGILGSNERDAPMMDEGLNSFYEMRYVRAKYGDKKLGSFIQRDSTKLLGLNTYPLWKYHEISYFAGMRANSDQNLSLRSTDYSEGNYGGIVYSKTAIAFDYLMEAIGQEQFDKAMKAYYQSFKFKHPQEEDLFTSISTGTGNDISWFVRNLFLERTRIDFKIKSAKQLADGSWIVKIRNRRPANVPIVVQAVKDQRTVAEVWSMGTTKTFTLAIPKTEADKIIIDHTHRIPEVNRHNNSLRTKGLFRKVEKLDLNFLTALENPDRSQINYVPVLGTNAYNGFMLGLAVHNIGIYARAFEYDLAPMFAFGTKNITGSAHLRYNIRPVSGPRLITLGVNAKSYAYDSYLNGSKSIQVLNYRRISPYISAELQPHPAWSHVTQSISYQSNLLFTDSLHSQLNGTGDVIRDKRTQMSFINQLSYRLRNTRSIDPFSMSLQLQHTASVAKVSATFDYKWNITRKSNVELRVFAGTFIAGTAAQRAYYAFRASGYKGWQDYAFEGNYYDRQAATGTFAGNQFMEKDGAMKVWTPWGQSAKWMLALNLKSPRLGKFPLRIYADAVTCDASALNKDQVLWDAGLNLTLWKDIIEVYLPVVYSKDIKSTLDLNGVKWYQAFRFTFNIHKLEPAKLLQSNFF
jgi:hypothetical protein